MLQASSEALGIETSHLQPHTPPWCGALPWTNTIAMLCPATLLPHCHPRFPEVAAYQRGPYPSRPDPDQAAAARLQAQLVALKVTFEQTGASKLDVRELDSKVDALRQGLASLEGEVAQLKGAVAGGVGIQGVGLKGQVLGMKGQLNRLEVQLAQLKGEIVRGVGVQGVGLKGRLVGVKDRVVGLRGQVVGLRGEVLGLKGQVSELSGQLEKLGARVSGLTAKAESMVGELDSLCNLVLLMTGVLVFVAVWSNALDTVRFLFDLLKDSGF